MGATKSSRYGHSINTDLGRWWNAGKLIAWVKDICGWSLEIVKRSDDVKGFKVVPKRWIVERTFAWLYRYRRLSKDYEYLVSSSENMIYIAMIQLMLRLLAMNST